MPTASFATLTGGKENPNKNTLRVQSTVRNEYPYEYEYITPGVKSKILTCKRGSTELLSVDAYSETGDAFSAGVSFSRLYTIQAGDVLSVNSTSEALGKNANVRIVVNGKTVFNATLESTSTYQQTDKFFSYTVKDGDEIQVFWSTSEIPVTPSTATLIVNSTAYLGEDKSDPEWVPDYEVDDQADPNSNSALKVSGYPNIPVHSFSTFSSAGAPGRTVYSKTYTVAAQRVLSIDIRDKSGINPSAVKITVNGNVLYNGVVEYKNANNVYNTAFSYTFKAGDLVVVDWIRMEDDTPVVDNPNKNTLWFSSPVRYHSGMNGVYSDNNLQYTDDRYIVYLDNTGLDIHPSTVFGKYPSWLTRQYTIVAGQRLHITTLSMGTDVFDFHAKVTVNGLTIYDETATTDAADHVDLLSYTVKDGDEIYVQFEKVEAASGSGSVQADTILSVGYNSYGLALPIEIQVNGTTVSPTRVDTNSGDYVTYFWYVPHNAQITISPTSSTYTVCIKPKNSPDPDSYNVYTTPLGLGNSITVPAYVIDEIKISQD